jgi:hypothetical protein
MSTTRDHATTTMVAACPRRSGRPLVVKDAAHVGGPHPGRTARRDEGEVTTTKPVTSTSPRTAPEGEQQMAPKEYPS